MSPSMDTGTMGGGRPNVSPVGGRPDVSPISTAGVMNPAMASGQEIIAVSNQLLGLIDQNMQMLQATGMPHLAPIRKYLMDLSSQTPPRIHRFLKFFAKILAEILRDIANWADGQGEE